MQSMNWVYAPSDSSTYLKYASGVLGRKPCIHIRLRRFAYQAASLRTVVEMRVTRIPKLGVNDNLSLVKSFCSAGQATT
jgi:hypothetical protein